MTFFDQSQDLGAVITKINQMAADINDKMFGRRTQTVTKAPAARPQPAKKADIYAHPETVLKETVCAGLEPADATTSSGE